MTGVQTCALPIYSDYDELNYTIVEGPAGMEFKQAYSTFAELYWLPSSTGDYNINISISDGKAAIYHNFTIHVKDGPDVYFVNEYYENAYDTNNNSLYDYISIVAVVNVSEEDEYSIYASLYTQNYEYVASASNTAHLNMGVNNVSLEFNGYEIYASGNDGSYYLKYMYIYDGQGNYVSSVYETGFNTAAYSYSDFELPPVSINQNYSDYGIDVDGNGLYEALAINVSIAVSTAGDYLISAYLYDDEYNYIAQYFEEHHFEVGNNEAALIFSSNYIYNTNKNTSYRLNYLSVLDASSYIELVYDYDAYITRYYDYTEFEEGSRFTGEYAEAVIDNDLDGKYDSLDIEIGVKITQAGNYTINGNLKDVNGSYVAWSQNRSYLDIGDRKSTRLNSSHIPLSRMPSSA